MRTIILPILLTFSSTVFGLSIEKTCEQTQSEVETAISEIKKHEFSCLKKLGREDLVKQLTPIIDNDLKIACFDDTSFFFGQLAPNAYATLPGDSDFPKIDINQFYDSVVNRSTIFHEMIHLLGYDHQGETLEMAYACKFACKDGDTNSPRMKAAIRICSGKYQTVDDPGYKEDLEALSVGYGLPSPF